MTLFGLDPDPQKRDKLIDRLLKPAKIPAQLGRKIGATELSAGDRHEIQHRRGCIREMDVRSDSREQRLGQDRDQRCSPHGARRRSRRNGIYLRHGGQADELAAESSRIFLGIQIQCANCHDHPSDKWKRQQFHALAAFFPRVSVTPHEGQHRSASLTRSPLRLAGRRPRQGRERAWQKESPVSSIRSALRDVSTAITTGRSARAEVKNTEFEKPFERLLTQAANKTAP